MKISRNTQIGCDKMMSLTSTDTVPKKKRVYRRKPQVGSDNVKSLCPKNTIGKKRVYRRKKCLPHDLIMEILTKVPARTLLNCGAVSKLWYNSIHNDKNFIYSHFLQSHKEPNFIFSLLNVKDVMDPSVNRFSNHFFRFDSVPKLGIVDLLRFKKLEGARSHLTKGELVGYSNGLPCISCEDRYIIHQPNRNECLIIKRPFISGKRVSHGNIICHGFGFDSLANEYKLVSIFHTADKQFNTVVFTLGTKSWRNISSTSTPIAEHDLHPIIRMRAARGCDKSAIFCGANNSGGCLFWKITTTRRERAIGNEPDSNNKMEVLLCFDLHDEKFQFIQLPPSPTKSTTHEQQQQLLVDYPRLLEFKGSPCIARIEKGVGNESAYHRRRHDHLRNTPSCCCCCKVHLYVLKDKINQVWVKEESFDVHVPCTPTRTYVPRDPCCFCFANTALPSTRICSFSNQVFLYWFNGECLQFYNLRTKTLKAVNSYITSPTVCRLFAEKSKDCFKMDFQLHCQGDSFLSLQTFVPEGVRRIDADKLNLKSGGSPYTALVIVFRGAGSVDYYPFLH